MTAEGPAKVLIVEDHPVMAEGLVALLDDEPGLSVLGWVATVTEAAERAARDPLDVALIDYRLPDGTGADAAAAIREHRPGAAVVFLSADDSEQAVLDAVEAGASGYLVKTASGPEIVNAVLRAADGEMLIPAARLASLLTRRRELAQQDAERTRRLESLTPREREILHLMTEGLDNREISQRLFISYPTVRSHVRNILSKMGARSRLEAVVKGGLEIGRET